MGVFQGVSSLLQVEAFCDVDAKKIARGQYIFEDSTVCEGVCTLVVYLDSYATGLISLVFLSFFPFVCAYRRYPSQGFLSCTSVRLTYHLFYVLNGLADTHNRLLYV